MLSSISSVSSGMCQSEPVSRHLFIRRLTLDALEFVFVQLLPESRITRDWSSAVHNTSFHRHKEQQEGWRFISSQFHIWFNGMMKKSKQFVCVCVCVYKILLSLCLFISSYSKLLSFIQLLCSLCHNLPICGFAGICIEDICKANICFISFIFFPSYFI